MQGFEHTKNIKKNIKNKYFKLNQKTKHKSI